MKALLPLVTGLVLGVSSHTASASVVVLQDNFDSSAAVELAGRQRIQLHSPAR